MAPASDAHPAKWLLPASPPEAAGTVASKLGGNMVRTGGELPATGQAEPPLALLVPGYGLAW
jgi:hypothetical protein